MDKSQKCDTEWKIAESTLVGKLQRQAEVNNRWVCKACVDENLKRKGRK